MLAGMRRLLVSLVAFGALALIPSAVASPTIRLAIIHVMRGCHVWATADGTTELGPTRTLIVKPGTRISIRISCPMSFDVAQLAGPQLQLGGARWQSGTVHVLVFKTRGVYRLQATNVEAPADLGLQTMGPDNHPLLTVRVK
jgi:hypothetical protein